MNGSMRPKYMTPIHDASAKRSSKISSDANLAPKLEGSAGQRSGTERSRRKADRENV